MLRKYVVEVVSSEGKVVSRSRHYTRKRAYEAYCKELWRNGVCFDVVLYQVGVAGMRTVIHIAIADHVCNRPYVPRCRRHPKPYEQWGERQDGYPPPQPNPRVWVAP